MLRVNNLSGLWSSSLPKDPDYSSISILLHMDGADASTTITDSGPNGISPSAVNGDAQVDTDQSVFGGASALFDGTGDYISYASNALFAYPGDFTIEWRQREGAPGTGDRRLIGTTTGGVLTIILNSANIQIGANGVDNYIDYAWSRSADIWYAVAFTRTGSNLNLYIDGTRVATGSTSYSFAQGTWAIGATTAGNTPYTGWIDEFRITKGVARSTGTTYPVASVAFPDW